MEKSWDHRSSYSSSFTRDLETRTQILTLAKKTHLPTEPHLQSTSTFSFWPHPFLITYSGGSQLQCQSCPVEGFTGQKWNFLPAIAWVKSETDLQATVKPSDETAKDTFPTSGETEEEPPGTDFLTHTQCKVDQVLGFRALHSRVLDNLLMLLINIV